MVHPIIDFYYVGLFTCRGGVHWKEVIKPISTIWENCTSAAFLKIKIYFENHLFLQREFCTSLLWELTVILFSCEKLNKLNLGDRGQLVGGGDRIMCSWTSGKVRGSSSSELKSCDIKLASSDTISSKLSTKLSLEAITFCKIKQIISFAEL